MGAKVLGVPVAAVDMSPWGKTSPKAALPYPLLFHLLDTAAIARELWDHFLSDSQRAVIADGLGLSHDLEQARLLVAFWAGLHDLGKLTPGFQQCASEAYAGLSELLRRDEGASVSGMRHAQASMYCSFGLLTGLGYAGGRNASSGVRVAQILGGHHGRFGQMDIAMARMSAGEDFLDGLGGVKWKRLRGQYVEIVRSLTGAQEAPPKVSAPSAVLITGLVILADWLASQEHYWTRWASNSPVAAEVHFRRTSSAAPGVVAEAGLVKVEPVRRDFAELHDITRPNPLQASVMKDLPAAVKGAGILVVTAATGDGKTETALEAERILAGAAGTQGLCFVLPTMATSDEMYKLVVKVVAAQSPSPSAVTLTHSMAWLNAAYSDQDLASVVDVASDEERPGGGLAGVRSTLPGRWLRGAKRPLLAQYAVGTIDQSLLAVLPVKHNALRLLALSGKTFVVDEAHAYDPYMQVQLARLLPWLGAYRCPVVLLSATLPGSVGDKLVRSYLQGAGRKKAELRGRSFHTPYPGWLFVDAQSAEVAVMSKEAQESQAAARAVALTVEPRSVRYVTPGEGSTSLPEDARLAVIERALRPLAADGGCAAVVCTTVADAQQTYGYLKHALRLAPGREIVLLHARFPGDERERTTRQVVSGLGRKGVLSGGRPDRFVVVATQVIEQSLDLDTDLLVSDLAPMAQLLQRAGRCWRHEKIWQDAVKEGKGSVRERPGWARQSGPRLVVLDPLNAEQEPPKHWGKVYPAYLLAATSASLAALPAKDSDKDDVGLDGRPQLKTIHVPGGVQHLVEQVHGAGSAFEAETAGLASKFTEHQAETMAQQHVGEWAAIPAPDRVSGLHDLHRETLDEVEAATRLGAESLRVLCCYRRVSDPQAPVTLDREGCIRLPEPVGGRLSPEDVRAVMRRTIPVRADLLKGRGEDQKVPDNWNEHPFLGDLVLLVHDVSGDSDSEAGEVHVGGNAFRLDPELGLVQRRI